MEKKNIWLFLMNPLMKQLFYLFGIKQGRIQTGGRRILLLKDVMSVSWCGPNPNSGPFLDSNRKPNSKCHVSDPIKYSI